MPWQPTPGFLPRESHGQRSLVCCSPWGRKESATTEQLTLTYFIDYAKTFDCVDHNKLWKILKEMGIPAHLFCLLRNLYARQEATIRTRHGTTDQFQNGKRVCQSCILSPCLFKLNAECIMRNSELDEVQVSSVQLLSHVQLFVMPWSVARQASLSITNFQSLLKLTSVELMMPSNYPILQCPCLHLSSIFPRIRVFSNESVLHIRWPKYWSFSFSISPSNEYLGLISLGWTDWIPLLSKGLSRIFSNTTVQKHQFFSAQPSL